MTEPAPFFIVASARSGTTLLRLILNRHPSIAVPPESRFITELWQGTDEVDASEFLARLVDHDRFAEWELPIEAVRAELDRSPTVSYREAISAVYRAYARHKGKELWGDKTPRYVEHIPFLAGLFPSSRFVHLVRDGRDVALSYADVPFGPKTVARAAGLWKARVSAGIRTGRPLAPGRYIEIHYEDLAESPEKQLRDLCSFLGISFEPVMLDPGGGKDEVLSRAATYNPHVTGRLRSGIRQWQKTMPDRHVEMFEAVAGDVLSTLGYPRRYPKPGLVARAAAYLGGLGLPVARVGWVARKITSRVKGKKNPGRSRTEE
ncbi:MAG: sulfotransferase [Actinomycetota bacterium]|nr:sulfotransferase [Actinomycetota bacterium]